MKWNVSYLLKTAKDNNIRLVEDNVYAVEKSYVGDKYAESNSSNIKMISVINVCVNEIQRGAAIGHFLLQSFIRDHSNDPMDLCVLAENLHAIKLYQKFGFVITSQYYGFSIGEPKPTCYDMLRKESLTI